MCEHCHPSDKPSRRTLLKISAASVAAALAAGCEEPKTVTDLPGPYEDHLVTKFGEAPGPYINPSLIHVPPPQPPQRTEYGDIMPRSAWSHIALQNSRANPMNGVQRITIHHSGDGKPF